MTEILYCQSPALFLLAVVLLICFFLRRQAHRVRAALDLVLCILLLIGGVVLYYLGMYGDCFTIHDFWQIRTSGWVGLGVVAAGFGICARSASGAWSAAGRKGPPARRRKPTVRRWRAPAGRRMKPARPTPPRTASRPPPPRRHPPLSFPSSQRTPSRRSVQLLPPLTHRSPPPEEQVKPCKNPDTKPMTLWLQCLPNTVQPR